MKHRILLIRICRYLLFVCVLLLTSCSFEYLTNFAEEGSRAPTAEECGSCHQAQYTEWKQSSHSRAYLSTEYKEQTNDYGDESCLFCHIPGDVQDPEQRYRSFNKEEGVTCISCHLRNTTMLGPHPSGALFSPHPISQDPLLNAEKNSPRLCGICHQETYDQWLEMRKQKTYPNCLGCHAARVKRSHSQGTGFFSNLLVAFEPQHSVRSHHMILTSQAEGGVYPDLDIVRLDCIRLAITINNNLPHDLPAGIYGEKHLFITINRDIGERSDTRSLVELGKVEFKTVIRPGGNVTKTISTPESDLNSALVVNLYRFHQSTQQADLIRSYNFPGSSPACNDKL